MNKHKYQKMIERENVRASENKINIYQCQACNHSIVTRDTDNGTTPMFLGCVMMKCQGKMASRMYRVPQDLKPSHEWYRPSYRAFQKLPENWKPHVEMGGLLFREIGEVIEKEGI